MWKTGVHEWYLQPYFEQLLVNFEGGVVSMTEDLVHSSIDVFDTIVRELLLHPAKVITHLI